MQIGQRFLIIEPATFRHEAFNELQDTVGPIDKTGQRLPRVCTEGPVAALVKQPLGQGRSFGRRQINQSQVVAGLVMGAGLLELRPALGVDQGGRHIRERVRRVGSRGMPLSLDKQSPAGSEATQGIVQAPGDGDEFGRHSAVEIRSSKLRRPLKGAVLVQDNALVDKSSPRQEVRQAHIRGTVFGKIHHGRTHVER
ncbi:hypothetical protein ES703_82063 [subsurface metagenome]